MGLTIIKKNEPRTIKRVKVTIYGDAGLGKTTLAITAKNPLLLDFDIDHGSNRAAFTCDTFYVDQWGDLKNLKREDYERYDVIILDTVGWAINKLAEEILQKYPSLENKATGHFIPEGWQALSTRFMKFLNTLLGLQKDIVMLAHAEEKQGKKGTVIRIDTLGKAKNIIYQASDQMGYLTKVDGKTVIDWTASSSSFGKNTAELETTEVPNCFIDRNFMDRVIQETKKRMTEKQSVKEADEKLGDEIHAEAIKCDHQDVEFYNTLVEKHKGKHTNRHIRQLILYLAQNNGLEWDKTEGKFIIPDDDSIDGHERGTETETAEQPEEKPKEKPKAKAKTVAKKTTGKLKVGGKGKAA